jgi:hypothetical protein
MRRMLLITVLAGTTLFAPVLVPDARASYDWFSIGSVFRVGAAHIAFVFGRPFGYQPGYYYRYDRPVYLDGYRCCPYCFHDGGYYYHDRSCPLVAAYFSQYRVDPYWAFDRYAPRYDGYRNSYGYHDGHGGRFDGYDGGYRYDGRYDGYGGGYRDDGRYDRYDRSDRYDRYGHHSHSRRHHDRRRHY